ncbi:MAG: cyanophycinase [Actinomycetota bacterium]|nr:cyanophycinase [Actinomycetota bacterium]MDQ1640785.1 cyanophycinase [Actinomycetota bacterium]
MFHPERRTLGAVPRRAVSPVPPGTLFVIGGAEDRVGRRSVLREFVRSAGGNGVRIAVVATASSLGPEILDAYENVFRDLGAGDVVRLRPDSRTAAADTDDAAKLRDVQAVFMTGGNQVKLSAVITGTRFGDAIHAAYDRGAVVGGTSAGASIVSEHMVAFGSEGDTPRQGMTQLSAGLGLLPGVVVDQHFDQRSRYGRLLSLVARSPSLIGIGIDEDTAAVIRGGRLLEVVGRGCVFVVDASDAVTDAHLAEHGAPMLVSGATVHTLPAGARFDLVEKRLVAFDETHLAHQLRRPGTVEDE